MNPLAIGILVTACVFAGGMFGLHLLRFLPPAHLTKETQDVVRLGTGTISVLASLLLGLLIATANTAYDTTAREIRAYAADLILLDGTLRQYGPDAAAPRDLLRRSTIRTLQDVWPGSGERFVGLDDSGADVLLEQARQAIRALTPTGAGPQSLRDEALQTANSLLRQRWVLIEQTGPHVPPIVVAVLVSWIVAIFCSFGLNAPRNGTVVAAFLVCSLAIGAAVFLVLEIDSPFEGLLRLSDRPMRNALAHMTP